jgi:SAM-dependent methyltransferase
VSTDRAQREQAAYDETDVLKNSTRLQHRFAHVFKCPNTVHAEHYFAEEVKKSCRLPGTHALDYGCNSGWYSERLKEWGCTELDGIDISTKAIQEAQERYSNIGRFQVMDAHKTDFPDRRFDLIVGRAILHHLDFQIAILEIHRILKPGGKAVFMEPLRDNPAGKLIRWMTPSSRTRDELPLSARQIQWADDVFGHQRHFCFGLFSVGLGMGSSLLSNNPNNLALRFAHYADSRISELPLKYWMRQAVLVWEKKH